jgi:hypothetical protein
MGVFNGFPADVLHLTSKSGVNRKGRMRTEIDIIKLQIEAGKKLGVIDKDYELPPQLEQMHRGIMATIPDEWKQHVCGNKCTVESAAATLLYSGYNHEVNSKKGLVSSSKNGFPIHRQNENMKIFNLDVESLTEGNYV